MIAADVRDLVERALDVARAAGASAVDARYLHEETESVDVQDGRVQGVDRSATAGIGVRVLLDGAWGFAGTALLDPTGVERAARLAVEAARSSRAVPGPPARLAPEPPRQATWETPVAEDPFAVPLEEKIATLLAASDSMRAVRGVTVAEASMDLWRRTSYLATSEGARIAQRIVQSGAGIRALAVSEREVQQRSYPNSFRGQFATLGYEHIRAMDLPGNAPRVGEEAVALLAAAECPSGRTTLVLDGSQLALQIHESIGHAVELDRVLGMEASYAGTSFLRPPDRGVLRYGSPLLTVTADATLPGALGSYGFDDEGVEAQRVEVIREGVFRSFLTSRETALEIGEPRSNGTMRASGWDVIPLIRMPNVSLEPGTSSLEEMISEVREGVFMTTNRSWSIDDRRVNFQFGCELAWEIRRGKLRRMLRNPTYAGRTLEFWSSLDAVAGPGEWAVWGVPNCGKGQPPQTARVAHGAAPARFRDVEVGVRG
jgi:TldD protein